MIDKISKVVRKQDQKKQFITWVEIEKHLKYFSKKIKNKYTSIYGIPRGGLIPAVMLSNITNISIVDKKFIDDKTLIVDDICDSGNTINMWSKIFRNNDFYTIFLRNKNSIIPKHYSILLNNNNWIVFPWEKK